MRFARILLICTLSVLALSACRRPPIDFQPEKYERHALVHDGVARNFLISRSDAGRFKSGLPLIVVLHGGRGKPKRMVQLTVGGFDKIAARDEAVVVYPEGFDGQWNDGREVSQSRAHREKVDDVGFIEKLIDTLIETKKINPSQVLIVGASNGAMMAHRLACEIPHKISAIAGAIGALPKKVSLQPCGHSPVSVLIMNGTEDPLVPWEGGYVRVRTQKRGEILSTEDTYNYWKKHNYCSHKEIVKTLDDRDPFDSTSIHSFKAGQCREGAQVQLLKIAGGGHTWPSGWQYFPERFIGKTSGDIDGVEATWSFFNEAHPGK